MSEAARGGPPHPVDVYVGARVRALRKRSGHSLESLAARLGLAYQQVQKYETGANRISASTLYEIARVLGVPVGELYSGLPGPGDGEVGLGPSRIDAVLGTTDGCELLEAFATIPAHLRRPLIALISRMSGPPEGPPAPPGERPSGLEVR
jgi:transcriptional regulator with XRE-family HTH domain